jgi:uroporphyrinogen III methyltransferase/synthase
MTKVYLVGAGPGDPLLLTVKGKMALERADVVFYDHLANEDLLAFAPATAERIYVGKKKSDHSHTQAEICQLMIDRARSGKTVVRLKGGDPFIFGRGGEEAEALVVAGVLFEVIPGVTASLGIAAYCGVPLTHREHTSVVTFITGHDTSAIDWAKVSGSETLVIYMGLAHMDEIVSRLLAAGRNPETPAIAARWATRPNQQVVSTTLAELPQQLKLAALKPPATVIIGDVAGLSKKLSWFDKLPLFGQRILVTRAQDQAGTFVAKLRELGADAIELPAIEIKPPSSYEDLDNAISKLGEYAWLIFTSANGVRAFFERLDTSKRDLRDIRGRICAIGPATRQAIEKVHLKVDLMPSEYVAESLVDAFAPYDLQGKTILLPRAAVARDLIPTELGKKGAKVDVVEAYRTELPEYAHHYAKEALATKPNWITFTSSSTVRNTVAIAGREELKGIKVASIGPITSATARELGLEVTVEAAQHTIDGLLDTILAYTGKLLH